MNRVVNTCNPGAYFDKGELFPLKTTKFGPLRRYYDSK